MYVVGDWVKWKVGNMSFGDWCSFPRKEKNSKPPNGGKCSPSRTNKQSKPQQGKTRRNPREGISRNHKPQRQSELASNGINSEMPAGQFQRISELTLKGINSEAPAKAKMNPREGISGDFHSQGRFDLAPKGNKFQGPAGKFIRSVQFLRRSQLAPKGNNSEVLAGEFRASGTIFT